MMNNNDERQIKACICTCTPPCHSSGRLTFQLIGSAVNSHKRYRLPASNPSSLKRTMARVWGIRS